MIHIDFLGLNYTSTGELIETLHYLVNQNAQYHKVKLEEKTYDKRFRELVKKLLW